MFFRTPGQTVDDKRSIICKKSELSRASLCITVVLSHSKRNDAAFLKVHRDTRKWDALST